jgi:fatty acid desaturase
MLTLFVLVVIMAVALATFFRRKVTALAALLGIPVALFLNTALGGLYALLLVVTGVLVTLVLHTISDTYRVLRAAERKPSRVAPERRAAARRSERSRIAA